MTLAKGKSKSSKKSKSAVRQEARERRQRERRQMELMEADKDDASSTTTESSSQDVEEKVGFNVLCNLGNSTFLQWKTDRCVVEDFNLITNINVHLVVVFDYKVAKVCNVG